MGSSGILKRVDHELEPESSKTDLPPLVGVIIPTHNRWRLADEALASLLSDGYPRKTIYLIDDGSVDGTSEFCQAKYPQVKISHGDGDLWWSGAINLGLRKAMADEVDLIIWLNDDNLVEKTTISALVQAHEFCGPASIIAARTLSTQTKEEEWAGDPPRWHPDYDQWARSSSQSVESSQVEGPFPPTRRLEHPPGGRGVLFPVTCFVNVGMIDQQSFPHYWADHDFHYRAMKAGYQYHLAARAIVWNRPNSSGGGPDDRFTLRWCRFFLFSRRSAMNLPTLHRLLKRHLSAREYRRIWYPLLGSTLLWLASGWINRYPQVRQKLRGLRRLINHIHGGSRQ